MKNKIYMEYLNNYSIYRYIPKYRRRHYVFKSGIIILIIVLMLDTKLQEKNGIAVIGVILFIMLVFFLVEYIRIYNRFTKIYPNHKLKKKQIIEVLICINKVCEDSFVFWLRNEQEENKKIIKDYYVY